MTGPKFYSVVTRTSHEPDRAAVKRVSAAVLRALRDRLTMDEADQVFALKERDFENLRVRDLMTRNPITTSPDVCLTQVAALMLEKHVGSLPVIENGKLAGIITDRDAVRALAIQVPALKYAAEALW